MFRYSYDALVYFGEDISQSIKRVARFGYDAIELVGEPDTHDGRAIRRQCADANIKVSSICSIFTGEARDLSNKSAANRAKAVDYSKRVADLAAASGAGGDDRRARPGRPNGRGKPGPEGMGLGGRGNSGHRRPRSLTKRQDLHRSLEPLRNLLHQSHPPGARAHARGRQIECRRDGRHVPHEHRRF